MPHLHKEEFQVLRDLTLEGERTFNLATRFHDLLWRDKG